ncbi:hypothetical protein [Haliangium sp.]|uniref:hypothetical protein n=1 Tax=Haliangium sp. TaxID=2663208 RepID=UPI003D1409AD
MEFVQPTLEQMQYGLRAMKAVALADGELDDAERAMLAAVQEVGGSSYDIDALGPITPAELAEHIVDPQLRWQLTGALVIMSCIDEKVVDSEAVAVARFAAAMEVEERAIHNLRQLADEHTVLARFDVIRRFWAVDRIRERMAKEGRFKILRSTLNAALGRGEDPEMAARYQALGQLPPGTLGRAYYDSMRDNQFPLPGETGSAPETITYHDMTHVLSGYGTTPEEEVLVACFSAGFRRKEPLAFVLFVLMQFHLGLRIALGVQPEHGKFDVRGALLALRRGAAMNIDLSTGWEYWDVVEEPLDELRRRYDIAPRVGH